MPRIIKSLWDIAGEDLYKKIMSPDYVPEQTERAYKMFRTDGEELYPLFVDANTPVPVGEWQRAISGESTNAGKVKSKIGPLAYRPGWHAGDNAAATHIGAKSDSSLRAPDTRRPEHVWAEVDMADDVDWQTYANAQGTQPRTKHVTDTVPYGGQYRYKTNSNMDGDWHIGGDMRVNRVLSDEEVAEINKEHGLFDLERREPSSYLDDIFKKYGAVGGATTAGLAATGQSEDADASVAGLAKRGLKLAQDDVRENLFNLRDTTLNDELVGYMRLNNYPYGSDSDAPLTVEMVELDNPGQGIGTLLYDAVEEVTGRPIEPSSELTEDGARFWARRDPDDLRDKWVGGVYDWDRYGSWDNVKRALNEGNATAPMLGATAAGTAGLMAPEDAEAGVSFGLAKNVDMDRLVSAWQKAVSRNPEIDPSTHLQNIIHNKDFTNYNEFGEYARKTDGGKNGETYFQQLKPFLIDISKHPKVAKDNRLRKGLVQYADTRFAQRIKQGHRPDGQRGSADPYSLLPVAGVGLAASSLLAPQVEDSGMISSPRSETLASATMGLRDLERRLEGSPMNLLFPEGLVNYLETVNRRTEDPNAMTRGMALLDVIP